MDDEWELCNDDGFVYKRRKKQHQESSSMAANAPNPEAEAQQRRERKKMILMKLREQYGREIKQWERLLTALQQLEKSNQAEVSPLMPMASTEPFPLQPIQDEGICQPFIMDELLLQAEAQEAILQDLLNLCDVAEASCKTQEECTNKSLMDLPIWATPRTLMASLSEVKDNENDCGGGN